MKWSDLLTKFFDDSFASRWTGACSGWTHELAIVHVVADLGIWIAYMTIPIMLVRVARVRKDIPFSIFFFLFSLFIVGCGLTHLTGAITAFFPYYYIDFWVKAVTAVVSLMTAYLLWDAYPQIITLPNPVTAAATIKQANKDLADTNEALDATIQANELLENFALVAAHDLQDPLKQNNVFLRLIQQGKYEFIGEMQKNNSRLDAFVKSLLAFTRSGGANLNFEIVSVKSILDKVIADLQKRIVDEGAKVIIGDMPEIRCDKIQLGRVFQNLLSNALKSKFPGRPLIVEINAKIKGDVCVFTVKDNGVGISEANMKNLFIIYRGKKNDNTGAGFGLAICKRVVESHRGTISAESKEGEGTKFTFSVRDV